MGTRLRIVETSLTAKYIEEACRLNNVKVIELKEMVIEISDGESVNGFVSIIVEVEHAEQMYYVGRTIENMMREK